VAVKGELMVMREHVAAGREREDSLTLEREMLTKQLEELNAAYVRDMAEARAHSAGATLLQTRLLETEGLLREAEAEIADLRRSVSSVLSRESTLVGKIMVARSEVVSAQTAKARADRLTQQQHMASVATGGREGVLECVWSLHHVPFTPSLLQHGGPATEAGPRHR